MSSLGTLYIVSLPIGNLSDITLRAIETLRNVDYIVAEDTRTTHNLLAHHSIDTPMFSSYYQGVEKQRGDSVLSEIALGKKIALVSDAGTPLINDPGFPLVREAIARGIPIVPVPGPSALLAALVVAGFPTDRFAFDGAVPRTGSARARFIERLVYESRTAIAYESPHRLLDTLQQIAKTLPDRRMVLARELTKLHEEVLRGTASEILSVYEGRDRVRGECVLVIEGIPHPAKPSDQEARQLCAYLLEQGLPRRVVRTALSMAFDLSRNDAYRLVHEEGHVE